MTFLLRLSSHTFVDPMKLSSPPPPQFVKCLRFFKWYKYLKAEFRNDGKTKMNVQKRMNLFQEFNKTVVSII